MVEPESVPADAGLVNRIDFLSGDDGKSSIIIGTTRPVEHSLEKWNGDKLSLNLFGTKILSYRQRPLITTRFESAVDLVIDVNGYGCERPSARQAKAVSLHKAKSVETDWRVEKV